MKVCAVTTMNSVKRLILCQSTTRWLWISSRSPRCHLTKELNARYYRCTQTYPSHGLVCSASVTHSNTSFIQLNFQQRRSISQGSYAQFLMSPDFFPVGMAISIHETVHASTGLPWWLSIALTTVMLRTCITLPLYIYSVRKRAKLQLLNLSFADKARELSAEVKTASAMYGWHKNEEARQFKVNMKRIAREEFKKHKVHPLQSVVVVVVQIPLWIGMSLALRNMSGSIPITGTGVMFPELASEGWLWFPNLLLPDGTFNLPIIMATSNLLNILIQSLGVAKSSGQNTMTKSAKRLTFCMVGLSIFMVPIAASVPSCLSLYWTCSSLFGLTQNVALHFPKVRRAVGIPSLPGESPTPFVDMWSVVKKKSSLKRGKQTVERNQKD